MPGLAVWKGDQVAACVAAASVLAKVTRDRIMIELDEDYPEYGFAEHKGYSTPEHAAALRQHGPCPVHRYSYENVAAVRPASGPSRDQATTWLTARTVGVAMRRGWRRVAGSGEDSAWKGGRHER